MGRLRGRPPPSLSGRLPVSATESPWWDSVRETLVARGDLTGRTVSIEELVALVPSYPDGRRPRARAAARRLRSILELVERGPNGSLGRGAKYRIAASVPPRPAAGREDIEDETIASADDWLADAVRRMTSDE